MSDSIGGTAEMVVRAAISQFAVGSLDIHRVTHVDSEERIAGVVKLARDTHSVLVFTLISPTMREFTLNTARRLNVPVVDIMGPMMEALERSTGQQPRMEPGLMRRLDEEYYKRIEAIEFTVANDDGKRPENFTKADVVILGVSRTSKTPVSLYLAQERCLKVSNTPVVPEIEIPEELYEVPSGKIVGLLINPLVLQRIRQERMKNLGLPAGAPYAEIERIKEEISFAENLFRRLNCAVLDVSQKAVEETAASVMDILSKTFYDRA
jgi:[pyruvate, water dikinase]-phosphate phosphotransferase / [pyruvate, water dikinase] kinase